MLYERSEILTKEFNTLKELWNEDIKLAKEFNISYDKKVMKNKFKLIKVIDNQITLIRELIKDNRIETDSTYPNSIAYWIKVERWNLLKNS